MCRMRFWSAAISMVICGCATTQPARIDQTSDVGQYRFIVIEDTPSITGFAAKDGDAVGKEVNPATLMEGLLLKKGLVRVRKDEVRDESQLLILRWGISGKRNQPAHMALLGMGGYAQEVTITLLDGRSLQPVFTCTAEGYGTTEADDIREAIASCLSGLK
ncbi:MAG: hypothetical protein ACREX3_11730 [Gammaproteobacteria bacterium]